MKRHFPHLALAVILLSGLVLPSVRAVEPAKPAEDDTSVLIEPIVNYVRVNGNAAKFREDTWMRNGWTGGIEEFQLHRKIGKDLEFNMEGRSIFNAEDYKLQLELIKPEFWFIRGGLTTYQKYFNGNGGYFAGQYTPTNTSPAQFVLGTQDLTLNMRNFFVEAGLIRPNLPKITIGYERQEKQGLKSSLEWGTLTWTNTVGPTTLTSKRIYPSFKAIDERTDIARLEIEHDIKNIHIGDEFRYERYQSSVAQYNGNNQYLPPYDTTPPYAIPGLARTNSTLIYYDTQKNDLFWNAFHVESHLNEKMFWSLGYLYTTVNGDAGFDSALAPIISGSTYYTTKVDLSSDSHVLNGNLMVDICKSLSANVGVQAEMTDESAFQTAILATNQFPTGRAGRGVLYLTDYKKRSLEEEIGLRWTAIPFTTVFAEAKLGQEQSEVYMDMNTNVAVVALHRVRNHTEVNTQTRDFKVGFNSAPLPRMTLSAHYLHGNRDDNFDGYTANLASFAWQGTETDELAAKLTLRPCPKVSMSFKYQYLLMDIATMSLATNMAAGKYFATDSGRHEANIYTFSTTVTPVPRLYVTGLFQYQDSYTASQYFNTTMIAPYRADVYTMAATAGFALDNKTDLTAEYAFTYTDNFNSDVNYNGGYNFGLDSRRHGIQVGVRRQLAKNVVGSLRYGYFEYVEDSSGGINNYRANVVTASCGIRF